jgi:hypothetical protein
MSFLFNLLYQLPIALTFENFHHPAAAWAGIVKREGMRISRPIYICMYVNAHTHKYTHTHTHTNTHTTYTHTHTHTRTHTHTHTTYTHTHTHTYTHTHTLTGAVVGERERAEENSVCAAIDVTIYSNAAH